MLQRTQCVFTRLLALIVTIVLVATLGALPTHARRTWQQGLIFWDHPPDYASTSALASLDRLAATGANTAVIVVPWYIDDVHGSEITPGPFTVPDDQLIRIVKQARQRGLMVVLFLRVDVRDDTWRGFADPWDKAKFFADYANFVNQYAIIANNLGVWGLVIGGEMVQVTRPQYTDYWRQIIAGARLRFPGFLTYSATWGSAEPDSQSDPLEEYTQVGFWSDLDYLGIAAYYNLADNQDEPTAEELQARWDEWRTKKIEPFQAQYGKPLLFTELGYKSTSGAAARPWDGGLNNGANPALQSKLYQSLFESWRDVPYVAGIYLWFWSTNPNAGGPNDADYVPNRKPVEALLNMWFAQ